MRRFWGFVGICVGVMACDAPSGKQQPRAASERSETSQVRRAKPRVTQDDIARKKVELRQARAKFDTKLMVPVERYAGTPRTPPEEVFSLVQYTSTIGPMHAYISPDPTPEEPKKYPLVIWKLGGFSNAISDVWSPALNPANDQSAAQFREQGLLMMYPSVRGAHDNPGQHEGLYGEVDDMLSAIKHAKGLDYIDPDRIYLGGHSTGGTLVLLVAAAAPSTLAPRAVFSLGPVAYVTNYDPDSLPFDTEDEQEVVMRAPLEWLHAIDVPTFIIEGEGGNSGSVEVMAEYNGNSKVKGFVIAGHDHFTPIAGINTMLAKKVAADDPGKGEFKLSVGDFRPMLDKGQFVTLVR